MDHKHHIQRVLVDIETNNSRRANELKNDASAFIQNRIVPIIERIFDKKASSWAMNELVIVEQMQLSISYDDAEWGSKQMERNLEEELEKQINEALLNLHAPLKESISTEHMHRSRNKPNSVKENLSDGEMNKFGETHGDNTAAMRLARNEQVTKAWLYFLSTGMRPWWATSIKNFEQNLSEESLVLEFGQQNTQLKNILLGIIHQRSTLRRIIAQYSDDFLGQLIHHTFNGGNLSQQRLKELQGELKVLLSKINLEHNGFSTKRNFWEIFFEKIVRNAIINGSVSSSNTAEFFRMIAPKLITKEQQNIFLKETAPFFKSVFKIMNVEGNNTQKIVEEWVKRAESESEQKIDQSAEKGNKEALPSDNEVHFFVENAGLVILQPFLPLFFEKIGVLNEEKKIINSSLAIHVLNYLATGQENGFEHNMLFEKFLVGHPLQMPIERNINLSEEIKLGAKELLTSVLGHWKKLSTSSIETLQETFLQRSGKLMDDYPQPRLLVERKTLDILMNKLDWNISIVKLPWMDKILFVEW